jgi:WD40 repeat protein
VATHKQISGPLVGDSSAASMLAFSPDGQTLAVLAGGAVQPWDTGTDQPVGAALSGGISAMAFSPDGRTLAAGDRDGRVQLWNVGYLTDPLALLCSQIGGSLTPADWPTMSRLAPHTGTSVPDILVGMTTDDPYDLQRFVAAQDVSPRCHRVAEQP